jgi:hypothetical protein
MRRLWIPMLSLVGCLDYDSFLQQRQERYCEEMAICNPAVECVVPAPADDTGYSTTGDACDFDRGLARECLNGTWTCDDTVPDFRYPIGPAACSAVCGTAFTQ